MAGIAGSHPGDLAQPVPGADSLADLTPKLTAMPAQLPAVPMDNEAAQAARSDMARPSLDDIFGASPASEAPARPSLDDIFNDKPAAEPSMLDKAKQFGTDLSSEFVGSFGNDNQKEALLKQNYGAENVRRSGDEFYVKRNGKEEKFTRGLLDTAVDLVKFTNPVLGSVLPGDNHPAAGLARDVAGLGKAVASEAIALPGEIAAAPAGPVAMFAARLAGGAAGEVASDKIGEALGLPKDANAKPGELIARAALVGGLRATLGFAFDKAANWINDKLSSKAVQIAERKAALEATPEAAVGNMINDMQESVAVLNRLKENGIIDEKFAFRPDQATHEANLHSAALQASKSKTFQDIAEVQGEMMAKSWEKLDQGASKLAGGDNFGNKMLEKLGSSDKAFGALIGEARQAVIKSKPDALIEAPLVKQNLELVMKELGFSTQPKTQASKILLSGPAGYAPEQVVVGKEFITPSAEKVADMLELSSASRIADAQKIIKDVSGLADLMTNNKGQLSAKMLNTKYTELVDRIGKRIGDNTSIGYTRTMIKLKDAIRDDFAEGIAKIGGAELGADYSTAMSRYKMFRQAEDSLGSLLERGSITSEQFIKHVFSSGAEGAERIGQMKKILDVTDPGAFQQLKGQWFKQLADASPLEGAKSDRLGSIDFNKFEKKLTSIGEDALKQVFDKQELANLRDYLAIGKKMQAADFAYLPADIPPGLMLRAINAVKAFSGFNHFLGAHRAGPSRINADAANLVLNIAPDDMALKYLTAGGVEDIMKLVPTARKLEVRSNLERIVQFGLESAKGAATPVPGMQTAPLAGAIGRGAASSYNNSQPSQH